MSAARGPLDIRPTRTFTRAYGRLTPARQRSCDRLLLALQSGDATPGATIKPILPQKYYWEARISGGDRLIFRREGNCLILVDIVAHDNIPRYSLR